ncbi:hypothetical protein ACIQ2D_08595 [Lysinibacillus sp. NPDC097287]|uniref:hypothetical protein n=1 Tax=Lysinibacillus sp. NPDC097287 TaxID=3364144 RepID=UPI003818BE2F
MNKLNGKYFIVDCYHHRIIYSDDLDVEIKDWTIINYEFAGPHSIASDGDVYVVDNTGRNEVLVFDSNFRRIQTIPGIEGRPHKVIYTNNHFYVLSSFAQKIYCYENINNKLVLDHIGNLDFMGHDYARSMNVIDGYFYIACETTNNILKVDFNYNLVESYDLPIGTNQLVDINYFDGYFYITAMDSKIYKTDDLSASWENIYLQLNFLGKPYFITIINNQLCITAVGEEYNGVLLSDGINFNWVYLIEGLSEESEKRRDMYPR